MALALFPRSQQIHGSAMESGSRLSLEQSGAPLDTALNCIFNFRRRMRRRSFVSVCLTVTLFQFLIFFGKVTSSSPHALFLLLFHDLVYSLVAKGI